MVPIKELILDKLKACIPNKVTYLKLKKQILDHKQSDRRDILMLGHDLTLIYYNNSYELIYSGTEPLVKELMKELYKKHTNE